MQSLRRSLGVSSVVALVALAGATSGCSAAMDPSSADQQSARAAKTELTATVVNGAVELHNGSARRLFYIVVEPRFLGLWGVCTDAAREGCHSIAPGATVRVPRAQIFGVDDSTRDVVVHWWDANVDLEGGNPERAIKEIALRLE
jgi:hypothetical protein